MLLGAPGVYNWHGVPMVYRTDYDNGAIISRLRSSDRRRAAPNIGEEFGEKIIPAGQHINETMVFDLLGRYLFFVCMCVSISDVLIT